MEHGNAWELACIVRFHAFPFIHDVEKRRPIRMLFDADVGNTQFKTLIKPCLEFNQFVKFCRILSRIHVKNSHNPRDTELIETLFWEESDPTLASHILRILLCFPTNQPHVWRSGTNLLLCAKTKEEKVAALVFLEAFHV